GSRYVPLFPALGVLVHEVTLSPRPSGKARRGPLPSSLRSAAGYARGESSRTPGRSSDDLPRRAARSRGVQVEHGVGAGLGSLSRGRDPGKARPGPHVLVERPDELRLALVPGLVDAAVEVDLAPLPLGARVALGDAIVELLEHHRGPLAASCLVVERPA